MQSFRILEAILLSYHPTRNEGDNECMPPFYVVHWSNFISKNLNITWNRFRKKNWNETDIFIFSSFFCRSQRHSLFCRFFGTFSTNLESITSVPETIYGHSWIELDYIIISSDKCTSVSSKEIDLPMYKQEYTHILEARHHMHNAKVSNPNLNLLTQNKTSWQKYYLKRTKKKIGWTNPNDIQLNIKNFSE